MLLLCRCLCLLHKFASACLLMCSHKGKPVHQVLSEISTTLNGRVHVRSSWHHRDRQTDSHSGRQMVLFG